MTADPQSGNWISLRTANLLVPDKDYDSAAENLQAIYGRSEDDPVWSLEKVAVVTIDPGQLIDDPTDEEALQKVDSIRSSIENGQSIPPVFLMHHERKRFPYVLIEGRHRYNAAHQHGEQAIAAQVAHVACTCSQPTSDGSTI